MRVFISGPACVTLAALAAALISSCGGGSTAASSPPLRANSAPVFTSSPVAFASDDRTESFYLATAADADSNALTFSLAGGVDRAAFRITSDGALSFAQAANFEVPVDSNQDNVYLVTLGVSDGDASADLDLTVTVNDTAIDVVQAPAWIRLGNAGWPPRDSAGEVVFEDKLWILGGWFSSLEPTLRDVWSSPDGVDWTLAQAVAPWGHSDLPMTLAFNGRMWMMGGYDRGRLPDATASNEIWSSGDGTSWTSEGVAGWSPRLGAGIVEFQGKLWILGGLERYFDGTERNLKNDVWFSEDGRYWVLATASANWSPRAFHNVLVFNDRIYLFGGGNYVPDFVQHNDVWSSADGVNWRQETARAEWAPRIWASAVVYRDRMWLLGGHSRPIENGGPAGSETGFNLGDVWYSTDGSNWTKVVSDRVWSPRHEMSAFVLDDRIWIAGGFDGNILHDEVWSLQLP